MRVPHPGGGVYHATKHAVEALSDALRFEVSGFGIDVVIIEPAVYQDPKAPPAMAIPPQYRNTERTPLLQTLKQGQNTADFNLQ